MNVRPLLDVPGVRGAALVGVDGLPLEAYGEDAEVLAAELSALRASLERLSRRLSGGAVTRLAWTSERLEVVAISVGEHTLGVSVARGGDTRPAQLELARAAADLARRLPVLQEE